MNSDNLRKLKLPKERIRTVVKKSVIALVLLFIPIAQLYSAFIAIPLFMHHAINSNSPYMEYTFAYFFPKSPITIAIFAIYYLAVFYVIELIGSAREQSVSIGRALGRFVGRLFK
jgi:ABC-type arginine/histidine transport system permease subunit